VSILIKVSDTIKRLHNMYTSLGTTWRLATVQCLLGDVQLLKQNLLDVVTVQKSFDI